MFLPTPIHRTLLLLTTLLTLTMKAHASLPIRILTHNIRYATDSPFKGEKPWADRKDLVINELKYNTLYNPEAFICLQEVLHEQLLDILSGLNNTKSTAASSSGQDEWAYMGVGRDDGKQKGEYSPILYRPSIWSVEKWKTVWLSPAPERPGKGWDAGSVRIVTVGTFVHESSKKRVVGLCTHFDNAGEVSRRESAKMIEGIVDNAISPSISNGQERVPVWLAGDLNSEPDGEAYQILNGKGSLLQDSRALAQWRYGNERTYYTLANPDTLTKYKVAADISQKVLKEVSGWISEGASIVELCERGDKLLDEEIGKVYRGKKIAKGIGHCTTISPSSYVTPYTPLKSDAEESGATLKAGEIVKIQLGAQIDGFAAIVCDNVVVGASGEITGEAADLLLGTYYANELLLRLMVPPGLVAHGDEEEQKKNAARKPYTQSQMTQMLEKVAKAYGLNVVESTTIWQFEHNEIESKKKIILSPGEGVRGEGLPEVGEVWGVEVGLSLGSGKVKNNGQRTTLHRRTANTFGLKRPTSRQLLSEVVKRFGTFPFSLRQIEDEKVAKVGVVECVRGGVLRQYEVVVDKDSKPVARLFSTIAVTKNGIQRLAQPPALDLEKVKSDKKIEDEEILKILEQPIGKASTKKNKKKKKKPAKKAAAGEAAAEEEESDDETHSPATPTTHPQHAGHGLRGAICASLSLAMPALRKSDRGPRSSTTPYTSPTGTPSDSAKEKNQRSIMEWTEPSVQNPTPSFEEHGFARHGVLEQMAPLGQPPSARVKQRTRAMGGDAAARKSLAGKGNFLGEEVGSTPEVTPAPELEPDDSERQEEDELPLELPPQEEDEDDDYVPNKTKKKAPASKTPVRGKQSAQGQTPGEAKTPVKAGTPRVTSAPTSPAVQAVEQPRDSEITQRAQIALLAAAESAQANHKPRLGEAFKQLKALSKSDPGLAYVINAICKQNQTPEQWSTFRENIKALKKSVKYEAKKKRKQQRNGDFAAAKSETPKISQQPSPRPSSEVAPDDSVSFVHDNEAAMENAYPAADATAGALPSPHPLSTAPTLPAIEPSIETAPRMPSKSPRKKHVSNSYLAPGSEMDVDGGASSVAQTPAGNTPDAGDGSDSELSEVNEEIVQKGPPTPAQPKEKSSTPLSAAAVKKGKNTAVARAGKKHANKGKLFGKHVHKNQPASTEQLEDLEKIYQLRKEMADAQPLRQFDLPFPQSDVRFDDEILETESLTESMIAVGPPVDSDQPRRAGRMPHGAKRLREDMSRFSSPQLESAAISRPTTPAVQPAIKRIKLNNGQAARTKRSPVKNRDGGPIAGVAFNGGGGSRQLGPDDNDPNSPASESDDLCSACRGAGEFVCCEGCPRVFHLLCCDPPRVQVPEGSFYCYECTARLSQPGEPAAESHPSLGPLFEVLEKTNPRAFALPQEIQNHFEDVSARGDGSYFEEIKKFPLAKSSGYGYQRPDYTKVLDGDKPILCVQCGVSSGSKRQMLKCDFCNAYWHLDCVDPPLANPPHISLEASQRDAWRCPRHIEHDLRSGLLLQNDLNGAYDDVEMGDATFSRVPRKIRRRKNPEIVEPAFSRGMRNNGLIDIINDPDDDTDGEGNYTGFEVKDLNSKVYRVPERGLITDFLSKIKSRRITRDHEAQNIAHFAVQRKASMQNFVTHSFQQQQAALNLARLAKKEQDIGLGEGTIDSLVLTLTAEAPQEVITAMTNSAPPPVAADERAQLLKLQELIQRRLNAS
ncbi:hypothetical protein BU25DRAFT_428541 [Macroventuria anomochaeta]|uniref:Uncharacterized protein n=1 Tax=Macroventuria anomochaeta TaxID=301207 RepID=A0ACB6SBH6_9PLEO|nr:uncharacterized protein BU25DRAFT_428541 [Macroventuria anomochaeta]KAF2631650.1 hypothetical protein BU25DRAFT_428541 [Macroventuria anomochaeta]